MAPAAISQTSARRRLVVGARARSCASARSVSGSRSGAGPRTDRRLSTQRSSSESSCVVMASEVLLSERLSSPAEQRTDGGGLEIERRRQLAVAEAVAAEQQQRGVLPTEGREDAEHAPALFSGPRRRPQGSACPGRASGAVRNALADSRGATRRCPAAGPCAAPRRPRPVRARRVSATQPDERVDGQLLGARRIPDHSRNDAGDPPVLRPEQVLEVERCPGQLGLSNRADRVIRCVHTGRTHGSPDL